MTVAIAHWDESCNGGGERVAWALARQFDAPLFVGTRDPSIEPADVDVRELHDGWTKRAVEHGGLAEMAAQQLGWEIAEPLREFDAVITSGNEPLAYVPPSDQTWVHYVHHTSRRATDLLPRMSQATDGRLAGAKHVAERVVRKAERVLYGRYARKPDLLVANSEPVARRIRRYWGIDSARIRVAYPPVEVSRYDPALAPTADYYLSLCRLDWHKGLDGIVEAFTDTDRRLLIAGDGREREALKQQAAGHDNIDLLGYVDEQRKRELLAGARAFLNNAYAEDFGLTTVEALASGTPVIGVAEGMTEHLVGEGRGVTYDRGRLREAVERFEAASMADEREIAAFAERFGAGRFGAAMEAILEEARERRRVDVTWPEREPVLADGGEE